jgi:hypothetical protein
MSNGSIPIHKVGPQPDVQDAPPPLFPNLGFDNDQTKYFEQPRDFRVVCIGAGFSGVYLGVRMPMLCPGAELVIYEFVDISLRFSFLGERWTDLFG